MSAFLESAHWAARMTHRRRGGGVETWCSAPPVRQPRLVGEPSPGYDWCDACLLRDGQFLVYTYADGAGEALYVGCTTGAVHRQAQHERTAVWWPYAASVRQEWFTDVGAASERELSLIAQLAPPFNTGSDQRYRAPRRAAS